jgi:hypothetical protein
MHKWKLTPAADIIRTTTLDEQMIEIVQDRLCLIEEEIRTAILARKTSTNPIALPIHFDFPTMTSERARTYVYFHIFNALREKNYVAKLRRVDEPGRDSRFFVTVSWAKKEDVQMEKEMRTFINHHMDTLPEVPGIATMEAKPQLHRRRPK